MAEDKKSVKLARRGAKARFTRSSNGLQLLLDSNREPPEIERAFKQVEESYEKLQEAHEKFTVTIENEADFEKEEQWFSQCQKEFLQLQIVVTDYCSQQLEVTKVHEPLNPVASPTPEPMQSPETCLFRVEKPKLPKFSGDVRNYEIFKSDFNHINARYGKRDAITILRSCLVGRPFDLIQGIGNDYDAAWDLLDSIYGDPRIVADTIINDLNKFRPLKESEDNRFAELVNLVRRSYNVLKLVGKSSDMDNCHMLATIERKMCLSDRKSWFRYQEIEK